MRDSLLLRRFAERGSQAAFAEVVGRYLRLVYGTCLREVGDRQMAEDVTQGVFLILAQKAPSLGERAPLAGWLFRTARLASQSALRQERRRRRWEGAAAESADRDARRGEGRHPRQDALHEALAALRPGEREAVLLRFFEGLPLKEVGAALGLSEDTAQKRVSRALEKMRAHLTRHGEALSLAALVGVLSAEAARSVPPTCAAPLLQIIPSLKIALETSSLFGSRPYQIAQGVLQTMKAKSAMTAASAGVLAVASASLLLAGAGTTGGGIVGTWTATVPQLINKRPTGTVEIPKQSMLGMTAHFMADDTFTISISGKDAATHTFSTMTETGTYKLAEGSLTMTDLQETVGGKLTLLSAKQQTSEKATAKFSDGGKTLTVFGHPTIVLTRQ